MANHSRNQPDGISEALPRCDTALRALQSYDAGSPRASLLPLDEAVSTAASGRSKAQRELEAQLLAILKTGGSGAAREYICAKLAVVGTSNAVPILATQLTDPRVATNARTALQAIPGKAASDALRKALARAKGAEKIGIINSLGARRDPAAVGELARLLKSSESGEAAAAAAALGEIGTVRAGRALRAHFEKHTAPAGGQAPDALLACAESLAALKKKSDATALLRLLLQSGQRDYVRLAAEKALKKLEV